MACPKGAPDSAQGWQSDRHVAIPECLCQSPRSHPTMDAGPDRHTTEAHRRGGPSGSAAEELSKSNPYAPCSDTSARPRPRCPKHAIFIVLSDEDDTSPPGHLSGQLRGSPSGGSAELQGGPATATAPEYVYVVNRHNQEERLDFACVPVDDKGTPASGASHAEDAGHEPQHHLQWQHDKRLHRRGGREGRRCVRRRAPRKTLHAGLRRRHELRVVQLEPDRQQDRLVHPTVRPERRALCEPYRLLLTHPGRNGLGALQRHGAQAQHRGRRHDHLDDGTDDPRSWQRRARRR